MGSRERFPSHFSISRGGGNPRQSYGPLKNFLVVRTGCHADFMITIYTTEPIIALTIVCVHNINTNSIATKRIRSALVDVDLTGVTRVAVKAVA